MAISVIIPTLNEAACIERTLRALRAEGPAEIIVADGGSGDGTVERAGDADRLVHSAPGRAAQMNAGAARARGEHLLFLHADAILEGGGLAALEKCLTTRHVIAGCFSLRVEAEGWLFRFIDWCATARVRLTGLAYGDQGLFLRRADFEKLGGFPPLSFMEDVVFSKELRRHGRIVVFPWRIYVSARRWQKGGVIRQTLRNWTLTALAAAGVHPDRLARHYARIR